MIKQDPAVMPGLFFFVVQDKEWYLLKLRE